VSRLHDLDAYVTGELADADAFEEALFEAPDDPDLAFFDRLRQHCAKLVAHGTFDMGVRRADLDALRAAGHTIYVADVGPPGTYTVRFGEGEFVVTQLHLGRTDLERVDVEITIVELGVTKTIRDGLVDTDGIMYGLCERPLAELAFNAGRTRIDVRHGGTVIAQWDLTPAR
jgi:hypothetical protein